MKRANGIRTKMQTKINSKTLTIIAVCVLLVGAVAANIFLDRAEAAPDSLAASAEANATAASVSFFESFRKEREQTRSEEIGYLDAIITQGADADTLSDAQQQKLSIVDYMEKELTVESLIKAKGFSDAAVTLHKGSVNVILDAQQLSDAQVAQVLDIILRETGETAENVKVSTAS